MADWVLAIVLVAVLALGGDDPVAAAAWRLAVWYVVTVLGIALVGGSPGHVLLGLRVARVEPEPVGLWRALVRTALVALVVPPVVAGADRRGLHDLAVGTVVVAAR
jgi:uncharacterized RDD family membrane protein YckC